MYLRAYLLALALALTLSGCSSRPAIQAEVLPEHENTLENFTLARQYQTQGRLEMARDRYLQALATARNPELKTRIVEELEAADRQIRSQR
jgi:thioredoxin-like negative regulator of GroEL